MARRWIGAGAMVALLLPLGTAMAQDVPGIEICTAEKTMERRTGCLQSNVDFLKATMTKQDAEHTRQLAGANRRIEALQNAVIALQKSVEELQGAKKTPEPAKGATAPATKDAPPAKDAPADKK